MLPYPFEYFVNISKLLKSDVDQFFIIILFMKYHCSIILKYS